MSKLNSGSYPGLIGMVNPHKRRNIALTCVVLIVIVGFLYMAENGFVLDAYGVRILRQCMVYSICALSLNLIQGYTGQFSLGSAGFMAVGAYATAILEMPYTALGTKVEVDVRGRRVAAEVVKTPFYVNPDQRKKL